MSNLNKLDFTPLDTTDIGYHKWVPPAAATAPAVAASDDAADATPAQVATRAAVAAAVARAAAEELEAKNAKAIILMIRHMDESLQSEYLNEEDPRKLWVALEERFGNVRESLLPDLEHEKILVKNYNARLWELKLFRKPIIVAPQREAAASETLNLGTTLDVLVHIIALLKKVVDALGEGEAVMAAPRVHNLEQEFDEENIKLRVEDFKAGKNDETPDFA
ncbi:hypothetical protein M0R45_034243 [Rubus argutus]|uniref:Uncharacterized protein n=1 Tax=Rubus argutus TaxID=59490 RepID=A0AAW1VQT6_RUBAR